MQSGLSGFDLGRVGKVRGVCFGMGSVVCGDDADEVGVVRYCTVQSVAGFGF